MSEWILKFLEAYGPWGVGLLMLAENILPPIPSEVVMPWAGYAASKSEMSLLSAIGAGSLGSFFGALFWYFMARWVGRERLIRWVDRHGAWLTLSRKDIERTDAWFDEWGGVAVLFCRMVPGIRTLISVPAGFAEMPPANFCVYTAIGTVLWTTVLATLGYWLGDHYEGLVRPLSWISYAVVGGLFSWWLWRLATQRHVRRNG